MRYVKFSDPEVEITDGKAYQLIERITCNQCKPTKIEYTITHAFRPPETIVIDLKTPDKDCCKCNGIGYLARI